MSVNELLKQVQALPPRQRQQFLRAVLEEDVSPQPPKITRRVKWPNVEARAKQIFGDRVLPNLILLEREETPF